MILCMISVKELESELKDEYYSVRVEEIVGINKIIISKGADETQGACVVAIDDDEGISMRVKEGGPQGDDKIYHIEKYEHYEEEEMKEGVVEKIDSLFEAYENDRYTDFDKL